MVKKIKGFDHKYEAGEQYSNMKNIFDDIGNVHCVICNFKTYKRVNFNVIGRRPIPVTVNNSVEDNIFYSNTIS